MEICKDTICTGCGLCSRVCPKSCIKMIENKEGFIHPITDEELCVHCGLCKNKCPMNIDQLKWPAQFYMAWNKDEEVLQSSSSGGIFTALAQIVFAKNGIVFGAELDFATRKIRHVAIEKMTDLDRIRLSKYYQSDASSSYEEVKHYLDEGRWVLFSGTACQIAALYSYLSKSRKDRLVTMDILCHGVTSKKVIDAYLKSKENKYNKRIVKYYFRVKTEDIWWSRGGTSMKLVFEDGNVSYEHVSTDTFFTGFNSNIYLRESCYNCHFCGSDRISDFTVADFWGINKQIVPEKQLKLGISVLLVNTDKGRKLLEELTPYVAFEEVQPSAASRRNRAFIEPNIRPNIRDAFFKNLKKGKDFDKTIHRLCYKHYAKQTTKKMLNTLLGEQRTQQMKRLLKH